MTIRHLKQNVRSSKACPESVAAWIINQSNIFGAHLKEEKFYQECYQNFKELKKSVRSYMCYYNNYRYSEVLNELAPNEFRKLAV